MYKVVQTTWFLGGPGGGAGCETVVAMSKSPKQAHTLASSGWWRPGDSRVTFTSEGSTLGTPIMRDVAVFLNGTKIKSTYN